MPSKRLRRSNTDTQARPSTIRRKNAIKTRSGPRSPALRAYCAFLGVFAIFLVMIGITLTLGTLAVPTLGYPIAGGILIFLAVACAIASLILYICLRRRRRTLADSYAIPLIITQPQTSSSKSSNTEEIQLTKIKENGGISKSQSNNSQSESDIVMPYKKSLLDSESSVNTV